MKVLSLFDRVVFSVFIYAFGVAPFVYADTFKPIDQHNMRAFELLNTLPLSGRIAFTAHINGYDRILAIDLDAKKIRKVIDEPSNNSAPSWSPDGLQISFTSDRDGTKQIYVADWEGGQQRRLATSNANDDDSSWSPEGDRILFSSDRHGSGKGEKKGSNLYTVEVSNAANVQQITSFRGRNTTPRWSPDGKHIAYSTDRFWPGWDVCRWNIATKREQCILSGVRTYCRPSWANTSNLMAYSFGALEAVDVGIYDLETDQSKPLTNLERKEYDTTWSPDDKYVLFGSDNETAGIFNIFIADREQNVSPVLRSPYSMRFLSWTKVTTLSLEAQRMRGAQQDQAAFDSALLPAQQVKP